MHLHINELPISGSIAFDSHMLFATPIAFSLESRPSPTASHANESQFTCRVLIATPPPATGRNSQVSATSRPEACSIAAA